MHKFLVVVFWLFFTFFSINIYSQSVRFENLSSGNGLLSDEVYNMHQDKQGYLWMFTNNGAVKYNGSKFKPVLVNLPYKEGFIYSIYENERGEKWVANSNAQIYKVRNDSAIL